MESKETTTGASPGYADDNESWGFEAELQGQPFEEFNEFWRHFLEAFPKGKSAIDPCVRICLTVFSPQEQKTLQRVAEIHLTASVGT